ncbi:hypothetical protein SprV_0802638400 [Sparganum proliferum]
MEVLGSGYMSPCSDFSQSFQSVRQTASDTCSPYSNLNCIQQNSPANQFSSPQLVSESQRISPLSNPFTSSNGEACTEGGTVFSTIKQEGHTCDVCSKVFSERSLLQKHKVAHADAKHICPTCGRAFVREDKLRRHIRSIHSDERPFVCEVCSKAFARKDKLQEHARHHNRDITFPCPACNEVFLMRSLLNRHLRLTHQMKSADSQNPSTKTSQSTNSDTTTPSSSSRKRSKRQANNNVGSAAVSEASNNTGKVSAAEKLSADLSYSSQQQQQPDHVGWNAANLLLYNRYQQQQAQQAQMEMPWGSSSGNAATSGYLYNPSQAAAAAAYQFPSQYAAAAMMRHARPSESQQQQQQSQQQQPRQVPESTGTTQQQYSAFSAAMAARLFSPSNYANWWQQAGPNFMFPQTQLSRAAGTTATATNAACYPGETQSAMTAVTTATTTPASGFPSSSSSSSSASYSAAASQALAFQPPNFSSVPTTANSSAPASLVELSSVSAGYNMPSVDVRPGMLASLPSFAQAVYYRAASLAASQGASSQAQSGQHLHQQTQQQHPASAFAPPAAYPP